MILKKLTESNPEAPPYVSYVLMVCCVLISSVSIFYPHLFFVLGNHNQDYWWQLFTNAFIHGSPRAHGLIIVHCFFVVVLISYVGIITERLIGTWRYLMLIAISWVLFALAQYIFQIRINGASGIIWAFAPFLWYILKFIKINKIDSPEYEKGLGILLLMWFFVTAVIGFIPDAFGSSIPVYKSFFYGNLFHFIATVCGFTFIFLWKQIIDKSLDQVAHDH